MKRGFTEAASCEGKEAFADRRIAQTIAKRISKVRHPAVAYRCEFCHQFHVANATTPRNRRVERNHFSEIPDA